MIRCEGKNVLKLIEQVGSRAAAAEAMDVEYATLGTWINKGSVPKHVDNLAWHMLLERDTQDEDARYIFLTLCPKPHVNTIRAIAAGLGIELVTLVGEIPEEHKLRAVK